MPDAPPNRNSCMWRRSCYDASTACVKVGKPQTINGIVLYVVVGADDSYSYLSAIPTASWYVLDVTK